ncbi:winged helix-turn-helix domain-containing protein [Marinicella sp. W31]|uniref:winged helix-turn-helix domain-containing protein n=1 Tax=Marinicella sp. W31 TaxID=3023713 RepID=UPI003756BF5B
MSNAGEKIIYTAGDLEVSPHQRTVLKKGTLLSVSKKSFDTLITLLAAKGDVVTKDDLIAAVWPGQIVTDAALNKQITRLRNTIDTDNETSLITTVRGVGFSMALPVQVKNPVEEISARRGFKYAVLAAIFALLLVWVFFSTQRNTSESDVVTNELTVAMMPSDLNADWLSSGSVNYVAQQLKKNRSIEAIASEKDWFRKIKPQQLAFELVQAEGIDYALLVDSQQNDDEFKADLILRNVGGIVAQEEIVAISLPLLFEKIENWVLLALPLTLESTEPTEPIKRSDYVLESYLRALAAEYERDYVAAAQLLQTAVTEDGTFIEAWLRLAAVEAELAHYQKALGLTETIGNLTGLQAEQRLELELVKARILIYLNKLEEAQKWVDASITSAEKQNNKQALIRALSNQTLIHDRYGEINAETLESLRKQLALVERHHPLPNNIAILNRNIAVGLWHTGNHAQAKVLLAEAIEQFERAGQAAGLFSAYRLQADIEYSLGRHGEALLILEKAEYLVQQVDEPILIARFLMSKARNQLEWGLKQEALDSIDALNQLGVNYSTQQAKVKAYVILVELHVSYRQFAQARATVDQLLAIISQNVEDYPSDAGYVAAMDMYLTARMESAEIARAKIEAYEQAYPGLVQSMTEEWPRIEAQILAKEGYRQDAINKLQQLLERQIRNDNTLEARYVGYELLDLQFEFDMDGFAKTLNKILELPGFDYPVMKYQAQLQAHNDRYIEASATLFELKGHAGQFWTAADQLLLEAYQKQAQ